MKAAYSKRRGSAKLVWILASFFAVFSFWAYNAPLDEIVRGPGVLTPTSSTQIVQSLEGGILDVINVREGDSVRQGQPIAKLNETRYLAEVRDFESQILTIEAKLSRLKAELGRKRHFKLSREITEADPVLADSEEQLFRARILQFDSEMTSASEQLDLNLEKLELMQNLADQNALPEIELLNAKSAASDAKAARDQLLSAFELDRSDEISALVAELARLRAQVQQSRDQLSRSKLLAPTDGVVNTIYTTTIGGVVQPGEPIFEITPLDDELLVEVRIQPKDIAFVTIGMPTTIKLSAYDYTIHGSLSGKILQVSADTFEDDQSQDRQPYYKVLVQLDPTAISEKRDVFEIRPGMLADAEVHVGEKTVLQYLLKPLIKSKEALREP